MRYHTFFSLIAGFLMLTCSAEADFTGMYGGTQIGFQSGKAKINSDYNAMLRSNGMYHISRLSLEGFNGGLHFGYGKQFQNHLYVGGEVSGRFHATSGSDSRVIHAAPFWIQKIQVRNNSSFDLSLKVGYVHQNFMPYVKAGVECAHYKVDFGGGDDLMGSSVSKTLTGFRPAIGFDYLWSPHWIFSFEYAHTFFNKISHTQRGVAPSGDVVHKIQPNAGVALLKVSYKI